jgi:hypothetical protein
MPETTLGSRFYSDPMHNFYRNQAKLTPPIVVPVSYNPRDALYHRRARNYIQDPSYLKKSLTVLQA